MGVPVPGLSDCRTLAWAFTLAPGKELQSEYFVPRQHAVEAILAVERLRDQVSPHFIDLGNPHDCRRQFGG